ncbi:MAG TPA: cyclic pyranopterin monophosphate synthase MoaC [Candidatus Poseidoniales archaeon]|jgi:cyclic pyranopterin phosphate synthase|nr:MAG: cyclic pyranopterin monophosphate synthase MoaC [Euryarchaeota archaeon]HIF46753.1 cyclic pyranopterin monophosphate synthase MoaC [Candidatus Poseidoniales archaeon]HIL65290.1 cyclic pyranopterin monophosphate synthase MoaC [Candidatus Poseidoniales archaeon]
MEKSIEGIIEIGAKPIVERRATATGILHLSTSSKDAIIGKNINKGDVIEASTIAAIQAVKETPRIIPHCHPIPLEGCKVKWAWEDLALRCTVTVSAHYKTGIEMEALTGVSAGLLCAFDMVKSLEKDEDGQYHKTRISDIVVLSKFKGDSSV